MPTLSQLYPTYGAAVRVVNDLEAAGVPAKDIALVSGEKGAGARTGVGEVSADTRAYAEGLKMGGTLVSVRADDAQAGRIAAILRVQTPAEDAAMVGQEAVAASAAAEQAEVRAAPLAGEPSDGAPAGAFQERSIEVRATGEEAVTSKEVRVFEEIRVRKSAADRLETVRDTVRETKVDVDDSATQR